MEVKGIQGALPSFIITEGEVRQAKADDKFVLFAVTLALTTDPVPHRYSAQLFLSRFQLVPLAHRATLKS